MYVGSLGRPLTRIAANRRGPRNKFGLEMFGSIVGQAHDYPDRLRIHAYNTNIGFIGSA
jgi:hypothetical protein